MRALFSSPFCSSLFFFFFVFMNNHLLNTHNLFTSIPFSLAPNGWGFACDLYCSFRTLSLNGHLLSKPTLHTFQDPHSSGPRRLPLDVLMTHQTSLTQPCHLLTQIAMAACILPLSAALSFSET